jgi:hypothetical protein
MDSYDDRPRTSRDTYLVVVLFILVGIPLFVFLNVITSGLFILMLVVASGLGVLGSLHYFLWGRTLNQEVASEREKMNGSEVFDEGEWSYDTPAEPWRSGPM